MNKIANDYGNESFRMKRDLQDEKTQKFILAESGTNYDEDSPMRPDSSEYVSQNQSNVSAHHKHENQETNLAFHLQTESVLSSRRTIVEDLSSNDFD